MPSTELKQSVKEYRKVWEDSGVEFLSSRPWDLARVRRAPAAAVPATAPLLDVAVCNLCSTWMHLVSGSANPKARVLFVGDGPDEDASEKPFLGQSGQLLVKIIEAMGFLRDRDTYLSNLVKCGPSESERCASSLKAQIRLVVPTVVVALGESVSAVLLENDGKIAALRGRWHPLSWAPDVRVMATYHPSHLLKTPAAKREVWEDMKLVLQSLGGSAK